MSEEAAAYRKILQRLINWEDSIGLSEERIGEIIDATREVLKKYSTSKND